jgi:cell division septum initiation protein DivIVA
VSVEDVINGSPIPTSLRGYTRSTVDGLLKEIEKSYRELATERDAARLSLEQAGARISELESQVIDQYRQRQAVSDALISAEQLKAAIEGEVSSIKAAAETEAAEILARAKSEADVVRQNAEAQADLLVNEAQRTLKARQDEAESFLEDTKERFSSLVRDLLERVESSL